MIVDTRPYKVMKAPVTEKEKKERDQTTLKNKVFNMEHRIEKLQDELELLRGQLKYEPKKNRNKRGKNTTPRYYGGCM